MVVPLNVLLKGREVAYHLRTPTRRRTSASRARPELPMAAEGWAGFNEAESCETLLRHRRDARSRRRPSTASRPCESAVAGQPTTFETVVTEATDTAVDPLHQRHDGPPEGR